MNNKGRTLIKSISECCNISFCSQKSGKMDNCFIEYGNNQFDIEPIIQAAMVDPYNCYPYIISVRKEDIKLAEKLILEYGMSDTCFVNPVNEQLQIIMSLTKGASKGMNSKKAKRLDDNLNEIIANIVPNNAIVEGPAQRGFGVVNEDLRITMDGVVVIRGEYKCISQQVNMLERMATVLGKALMTGNFCKYNLFVSFIGHQHSFLSCIQKSPQHFADAYIEFDKIEQSVVLNGDMQAKIKLCQSKVVWVPIDISNTSKGIQPGPSLFDYIMGIINSLSNPY